MNDHEAQEGLRHGVGDEGHRGDEEVEDKDGHGPRRGERPRN